jgi:hypothetical protein
MDFSHFSQWQAFFSKQGQNNQVVLVNGRPPAFI